MKNWREDMRVVLSASLIVLASALFIGSDHRLLHETARQFTARQTAPVAPPIERPVRPVVVAPPAELPIAPMVPMAAELPVHHTRKIKASPAKYPILVHRSAPIKKAVSHKKTSLNKVRPKQRA